MTDKPVRIDKWLWAARLFKTRGLAKQAIEGGKVYYNGARSKPSRHIEVGAILKVRQGWSEKTIVVEAISEQRRSAPDAAKLFTETQESVEQREVEATKRKLQRSAMPQMDARPTKKQRRQIIRFKNVHDSDTPD